MDKEALKAFLAIAEHQSFSKAADKLFVTQPAISKRIAMLENELGALLFDRVGRTTVLTEAGRTLHPRAQHIVLALDDARRAITNLGGTVGGKLRIGTSHHIGLHRLAPVLRAFTHANPNVQLDIHFLDSEQGCLEVEQGKLELAIVTLPTKPSAKLALAEIWSDPLSFVFAKHHPLATIDGDISVADLSRHAAILPAIGTFTRDIIERACQKSGVNLQVTMETNYLETIKMMVCVGLGWSALPNTMLDQDLHAVTIKGIKQQRSLGTVTHKQRTLSNAAQALLSILDEMALGGASSVDKDKTRAYHPPTI